MRTVTRVFRPILGALEDTARRVTVGSRDPEAYAFYARLTAEGCAPNSHIVALPTHRIIYVSVPKCASSRIKMTLSALIGYSPKSSWEANNRRFSGLKGPKYIGLSTFHRLATDPATLSFAFVRNPYARLVSCWADKFCDKPLVAGDAWVDKYLAWHAQTSQSHPTGPDCTLDFADFVSFAASTALARVDYHWHLQSDIINMPGIELGLIGKVETFERDFDRVLDHARASTSIRQSALTRQNESSHGAWTAFYTQELADSVYRAYERDFDELQYPKRLPGAGAQDTDSGST